MAQLSLHDQLSSILNAYMFFSYFIGFCDRTFSGLQIDSQNRNLELHDGSFGIASTYFNEPEI